MPREGLPRTRCGVGTGFAKRTILRQGHAQGQRIGNCRKYDRRCFCFGYLVAGGGTNFRGSNRIICAMLRAQLRQRHDGRRQGAIRLRTLSSMSCPAETLAADGLVRISKVRVEATMSLGQRRQSAPGAAQPVIFLLSGAAMLGLTACGEQNAYVAPPAPKVVVAQPLQQPVTRYIELTGSTQAINIIDLEARVQGFLEKINYVDGTLVKKGSLLFGIQRNTYEAQLAQAKATLAANEALQINTKIQYDRQA